MTFLNMTAMVQQLAATDDKGVIAGLVNDLTAAAVEQSAPELVEEMNRLFEQADQERCGSLPQSANKNTFADRFSNTQTDGKKNLADALGDEAVLGDSGIAFNPNVTIEQPNFGLTVNNVNLAIELPDYVSKYVIGVIGTVSGVAGFILGTCTAWIPRTRCCNNGYTRLN